MCNRYANRVSYRGYVDELSDTRLTPKTKWQFTLPGADWFCFAGIWDRAETADGTIESYALTTLPPDPAFEQYHDRAPLVLERDEYTAWLDSPESATALFTAPKKLPLQVVLATV